ncbi:MAG: alpha-(1-_3)-arabinofuranosyltransferase family protein [Dermatophilaceae bacterium]
MSRRRAPLATLAGLFVVWTVAWSTPAGQIGEDTKNDLYVDAWGLLRRALHLWDPQVTWGMLQNQGYGYLFPMGPFFALGSEVFPVWIVQRLWWTALLTLGYLSTLGLLRALRLGPYAAPPDPRHTPAVWAHLGALAYALAPRVLSSLGAISPEAQAQLLAPLILLPLVKASDGRLGHRRAAALSAGAILLCGGVNATATLLAVVPAGLWLLTRHRWWRAPLTWWWASFGLAATAWWLGPLLVLGRYSPPFLGWIENAAVVAKPVGLLDVVKGTTNWLGHVVVLGGPWWPAGWAIADQPLLVVASSLIGGLGLAGLALPGRHRRFLLLSLLVGLALLAIPHPGPLASPLAGSARDLLDGPLAPFRNVHKADPLVRLPLVVGLVRLGASVGARLGGAVVRRGPRFARLRPLLPASVALSLLTIAGPAMSGSLTTRGTFTAMPRYWADAGAWLAAHERDGGSLLLPAASFGEYTWGRTIDEPLRSLTTASYAVRDAVPLTPAGTIRFLDEIERRAQTGRDLGGVTSALLSTGVKYLVLRGDLDTGLTGGPPVAVTRSALRDTPGVRLAAAFGRAESDFTGQRVRPVEIYAIDGTAASALTSWPSASLPVVSGASEALPLLRESGLAGGPVIFDGDATATSTAPRIETDTFRARHRFFGVTRGQDASRGLTATEAGDAPDYLPWPALARRAVTAYGEIADVTASSAISDEVSFAGLRPAHRAYAALDADPRTAWLAYADPQPTLTVAFTSTRRVTGLLLTPPVDALQYGAAVAAPTRVRVWIGGHSRESTLAPEGRPQPVAVPGTPGDTLRIEILTTAAGTPATTMTGLAAADISGLAPTERVLLPTPATSTDTGGVILSRDPSAFDGCLLTPAGFQCLEGGFRAAEETGGLRRSVHLGTSGAFRASGVLRLDPLHPAPELTRDEVTIRTSSQRSVSPADAPEALLDEDPSTAWSPSASDATPTVTVTLPAARRLGDVRLDVRAGWLADHAPVTVEVTRDGERSYVRLGADGILPLAGRDTRTLRLRLFNDAGKRATASLEVAALHVDGLDLPAPTDSVGAPCGAGPALTVGGRTVPTSVIGRRGALVGAGSLVWQACEPVALAAGTTELTMGRWHGMSPATAFLRAGDAPVAGSAALAGAAVPARPGPGGRLEADLTPGSERVLTTRQNANPGWRATLDGHALTPQTVDGFRQGFVVPAGAAGRLTIAFAPDRAYRLALLLGGILAAGLVAALLVPGGRPRALAAAAPLPARLRRVVPPVGVLAVGETLAGRWGVVTAALALVVPLALGATVTWRRVMSVMATLIAGLVLVSGVLQAAFGSGASSGPVWLETMTRSVTLLALLIALTGSPDHQRTFDDDIRQRGERERDRHAG